ncbi:MAG: hypothetical protein RAO94_05655 [Candidatus Stygibacter australis]|nr:hypothetical protein [Candidatus Stygibacter australis]MDP8321815.1 hypothetical protein [Candidatus Stygibacter australis]
MSGKDVAQETVNNFEIMFDLSLTKDKMMDMMPGLLLFLARRPEMVDSVLKTMLPMMEGMGIAVNDDLLIEMMPGVVKAVDMEPELGGKVFQRMIPMMQAFGLKMNFYIMKNVMGMMMMMMFKHPRVIPSMMTAMPKMM